MTGDLSERVALQLYTVRDAVAQDILGVLRQVAAMGYRGVEFAGFGGLPPRQVREVLDGEGLSAVACHVGAAALEDDFEGTLAGVREVGASYAVCPWIDPAVAHDAGRWDEFAARLEGWARGAEAQGLRFAYHNHVFEFEARHGDEYALDRLFARAPTVLMELDAAWAHAGGVDPVAYLHQYAGRVPLLHVKDVTGARETVELGQGEVDLTGLLAAAPGAGVQWLIAEQDECQRDPMVSASANARWLQRALGAAT